MKPFFTLTFFLLYQILCANNIEIGSIQGKITDNLNSEPLAGAKITIQNISVETDARGVFEINQIPVGNYTLIIEKSGYINQSIPLSIEANKTEKISITLKINVLSLPEILITADRALTAASSQVLNALDFKLRPINSAQDLLRNIPGVVTAQHAGGGKAEQTFLRGFDCDHGTDIASFVDGIPVNMPSHGHGQGYMDLHFLIPEVVKNAETYKGTYFAELGDFATAGAIKFKTLDRLDNNTLQFQLGGVPSQRTPSFSRGLLMYKLPVAPKVSSYIASEYISAPAYFDASQNFKRFSIMSKTSFDVGKNGTLRLLLTHFNSKWDASGQIPERAIEKGLIDRFGAIDNNEGGNTGRQNASLTYTQVAYNQSFEAQAFVSHYNFQLFSNFTLFKEDTINGDMIRQRDNRTIAGLNTKYVVSNEKNKFTMGAGLRYDDIDNNLAKAPKRVIEDFLADARTKEANTFLYAKNEFILSPQLRAELGLRFNYFNFDVTDRLPTTAEHANYTGTNYQTQIAPKFNLTYSFAKNYKLFLNIGKGFHSNDARSVVQNNRNHSLPNAWGSEIGLQAHPLSSIVVSAVVWGLELGNELVFVGDDGTTADNGASRRYGLDLSVRAKLTNCLFFDADLNLTKGRLLEKTFGAILPTDNIIPLAPTLTSTGGLTAQFPLSNGHRIESALRYRHVSERAANEANTVRALGYTLVDWTTQYKVQRYMVGLSFENLLNSKWNEAQFDTESRLKNEAAPVSELHFTPGTPFAIKATFSYSF